VVVWAVVVSDVDVVVLARGIVVVEPSVVVPGPVVVPVVVVGVEFVVWTWVVVCVGAVTTSVPPVSVERLVVEFPA
jgi:hypothetical protein